MSIRWKRLGLRVLLAALRALGFCLRWTAAALLLLGELSRKADRAAAARIDRLRKRLE